MRQAIKQMAGISDNIKSRLAGEKTFEAVSRRIFLNLCALAVGFFLARCNVFAGCLPFGIAFAAALSDEFLISGGFGAALSYFMLSGADNVKYIGAVILCVVLKYVISLTLDKRYAPLVSMLSAFVAACFSGMTVLFSGGYSSEFAPSFFSEMLLASGISYFIAASLPLLNSNRTLSSFNIEELTAIVISLSLALAAASPLRFFDMSAAQIVAGVLVLFAAKYGYISAGAVCGTVFGFALCLSEGGNMYIAGAYALGGLAAGAFARIGTPAIIAAFVSANMAMAAGAGGSVQLPAVLVQLILSCCIFLVAGKRIHGFFNTFFAPAPHLARVDGLRRNMVMRLQFASDALCDVSDTVQEVSKALEGKNAPAIDMVFQKTEQSACVGCGLRIHCFETAKASTYEAFLEMTRDMRRGSGANEQLMPETLKKRCLNPQRVVDSLYENFTRYNNEVQATRRVSAVRSVVSQQMGSLSDMLFDMSQELNRCERYDTETAEAIAGVLYDFGISPTDVCCKLDTNGSMRVEIAAKQSISRAVGKAELANRISRAAARRFSLPSIVNNNSRLTITLSEKENFKVDVGVAQLCPRNEKLCGDSYSYFNDGRGSMIMILSDGMGSGGAAAVDSKMASKLLSRLIKAGFGFECSLRLINSAMMFKSTDESLATVDITAIDLYSGQVDFYKAGTPETIVLKGNKTGRAVCNGYPAGILHNVKFDKTTTDCGKNDIIVMMSDGVTYSDTQWIDNALKSHRKMCAQDIAENLATLAARRRDDNHEDDITVMVAVIDKTR